MNHPHVTTVLVTGVGDTVGQALIKAARHVSMPCRVLGTDRDELSVGLRWVDKGFILPHCNDRGGYLAGLGRICRAEAVDLILPGSEKELVVLSEGAAALRAETGAIVVASPVEVLQVALDKLETCRFLQAAGLNYPQYARPECEEEVERLIGTVGFPLLVKPRHGTGARGIAKILCRKELEEMRTHCAGMVLQEYLQPDDAEYSVEVYTLKNGAEPGAISYWRGQLIGGDTSKARIAPNEVVEAEARAVARALGTRGPCNVQLRVTARGPVTFEINPRFSGGVSLRAHFGYNEVEMAIRDLVLEQPIPRLKLASGEALRFWDELYIDDEPGPAANAGSRSALAAVK